MPFVTSADGTEIAYETAGSGPPLIIVDGAMCFRDSGPARPMSEALKGEFAVTIYDRRGRGESGNTAPYSTDREIEDLEAVISAQGGPVYLYGASSGGLLALDAANRNAAVTKVIAYETPVMVDDLHPPLTQTDIAETERYVADGNRTAAVKKFMRFVGVPAFGMVMMSLFGVFKKLDALAPTLANDYRLMLPLQQGKPLPKGRWDAIAGQVLIADGGKSPKWMRNGQQALSQAIPGAQYRTIAGQTHIVNAKVHAPVVVQFFKG